MLQVHAEAEVVYCCNRGDFKHVKVGPRGETMRKPNPSETEFTAVHKSPLHCSQMDPTSIYSQTCIQIMRSVSWDGMGIRSTAGFDP